MSVGSGGMRPSFIRFFCFILRFWNQILTCISFSSSADAISIRRARVRYLLKWNSFSNSVSFFVEKAVRPELLWPCWFGLPKLCPSGPWWGTEDAEKVNGKPWGLTSTFYLRRSHAGAIIYLSQRRRWKNILWLRVLTRRRWDDPSEMIPSAFRYIATSHNISLFESDETRFR